MVYLKLYAHLKVKIHKVMVVASSI